MTSDRRRQLEVLLIVRRAERACLVAVPARRPPGRRGASAAGTSEARDDAADDIGKRPRGPALRLAGADLIPFEETAMSSIEEVGLSGRSDPLADSADSAVGSGSLPNGRRCQWHLRSVESAIPWMRRGLRAFLVDTGLPHDDVEDLVLAACEAATNAVEHAQHPTEPFFDAFITMAEGVVTIVIRDHGEWRQPTSDPYRGRGLAMMRVLADTTVSSSPDGTTVTIRSHRIHTEDLADEGRAS
jgi:anti-sigma regulatory factor (Ser/Thr protein kinase)